MVGITKDPDTRCYFCCMLVETSQLKYRVMKKNSIFETFDLHARKITSYGSLGMYTRALEYKMTSNSHSFLTVVFFHISKYLIKKSFHLLPY